jgi:hypothetical protein
VEDSEVHPVLVVSTKLQARRDPRLDRSDGEIPGSQGHLPLVVFGIVLSVPRKPIGQLPCGGVSL